MKATLGTRQERVRQERRRKGARWEIGPMGAEGERRRRRREPGKGGGEARG